MLALGLLAGGSPRKGVAGALLLPVRMPSSSEKSSSAALACAGSPHPAAAADRGGDGVPGWLIGAARLGATGGAVLRSSMPVRPKACSETLHDGNDVSPWPWPILPLANSTVTCRHQHTPRI